MKYKVGDKVKIVDSTREEDSIYGFTDGEVVTIKDCYVDRPRYIITNGDTTGYIDECNLTDLNSYTWEDFLKAPIGTKITFENKSVIVKNDKDLFENKNDSLNYNDLENFKDNFSVNGKIIKIEEPTYTIVYEPEEVTMPEIEEMKRLTDELCRTCDEFIKKIKEKE